MEGNFFFQNIKPVENPIVADPTPAILPWIAHMEIMHKLDSPFLTRRLLAWQFPPAVSAGWAW